MRYLPALTSLLMLAGPLCAQGQAPAPAPGPAAPPAAATPGATADKPDVALLNRTIAALQQSKALETRSDMEMTAVSQGMTVVFRERIHLLLLKPGKYHSDIALVQSDGTPGAKYTVISNGARVWVYRPGANQYAVMPRAAFESNDLAGLGVYGSLVSDSVGDAGSGLLDLGSLTKSGVKLQGGTQTLDGADYQVFAMTDPKQGYKFRFLLDPQQAVIHQLDMNGQQKGLNFTLKETVTTQTSSPTLTPALFAFTPPPGAKRVAAIPIGPF